jgi:hypothetical protein
MKTWSMAGVLALALVAGACSGTAEGDDGVATLETETTLAGGDTSADGGSEVDAEQAMMDLAACLREQGLDIEDPTVDADGNVQFGGLRGGGEVGEPAADRETMRAAMDACQDQLGDVVLGFGGRDFDPTEMEDTLVEYAACMRDNGYEMDDPDFSSFGPGTEGEPGEGARVGPFGQIDQDDPDFAAANEACGEILGGLPRVPGQGRGGA